MGKASGRSEVEQMEELRDGGKRKGREQGRRQCSGSVVATANGVSEQHLANVCVCPSVLPHSCSSLH